MNPEHLQGQPNRISREQIRAFSTVAYRVNFEHSTLLIYTINYLPENTIENKVWDSITEKKKMVKKRKYL